MHYSSLTALEGRTPTDNSSVHVINIDIQDNHEEATLGAFLICELMTVVSSMCQKNVRIFCLLHPFLFFLTILWAGCPFCTSNENVDVQNMEYVRSVGNVLKHFIVWVRHFLNDIEIWKLIKCGVRNNSLKPCVWKAEIIVDTWGWDWNICLAVYDK